MTKNRARISQLFSAVGRFSNTKPRSPPSHDLFKHISFFYSRFKITFRRFHHYRRTSFTTEPVCVSYALNSTEIRSRHNIIQIINRTHCNSRVEFQLSRHKSNFSRRHFVVFRDERFIGIYNKQFYTCEKQYLASELHREITFVRYTFTLIKFDHTYTVVLIFS